MTTKTQNTQEHKGSDVRRSRRSRVYYAADPMRHSVTGCSGVFPLDFVAVASIESDDLDVIWEILNDFEMHNAPSHVILRSMSIGDAVTTPDGRSWILSYDEGWIPIAFDEEVVLNKRRHELHWS